MTDNPATILPAGRVIQVGLEIALPQSANKDEILEWLAMEIGGYGSVSNTNPLANTEPEALREPTLTDTGRYVSFLVSDVEETDRGYKYRVTKSFTQDDRPRGKWKNKDEAVRDALVSPTQGDE